MALLAFATSLGCTGEIGTPSTSGSTGPGTGVDADGDGQVDGFDTDGDGQIDDPGSDIEGDASSTRRIPKCGGELGSTAHRLERVPFVMAGSAAGELNTGRFHDFDGQPHAKLLVSIAQLMGLDISSVGNRVMDSGPLAL